ncbi:unnamed protein product [Urochloa humidicola]
MVRHSLIFCFIVSSCYASMVLGDSGQDLQAHTCGAATTDDGAASLAGLQEFLETLPQRITHENWFYNGTVGSSVYVMAMCYVDQPPMRDCKPCLANAGNASSNSSVLALCPPGSSAVHALYQGCLVRYSAAGGGARFFGVANTTVAFRGPVVRAQPRDGGYMAMVEEVAQGLVDQAAAGSARFALHHGSAERAVLGLPRCTRRQRDVLVGDRN